MLHHRCSNTVQPPQPSAAFNSQPLILFKPQCPIIGTRLHHPPLLTHSTMSASHQHHLHPHCNTPQVSQQKQITTLYTLSGPSRTLSNQQHCAAATAPCAMNGQPCNREGRTHKVFKGTETSTPHTIDCNWQKLLATLNNPEQVLISNKSPQCSATVAKTVEGCGGAVQCCDC